MLELDQLVMDFSGFRAVNGCSFRVEEGSITGLIGPNGAGKSTFIDAVTGFLSRYEGEVLFQGQSIDGLQAAQRANAGLRRTWQTTRIAPDLSVGAYVDLASGGGLSEQELDAVLAWLDCPTADTPISAIDSGARRLLDVAGVVAARPPVILLDEPAAG